MEKSTVAEGTFFQDDVIFLLFFFSHPRNVRSHQACEYSHRKCIIIKSNKGERKQGWCDGSRKGACGQALRLAFELRVPQGGRRPESDYYPTSTTRCKFKASKRTQNQPKAQVNSVRTLRRPSVSSPRASTLGDPFTLRSGCSLERGTRVRLQTLGKLRASDCTEPATPLRSLPPASLRCTHHGALSSSPRSAVPGASADRARRKAAKASAENGGGG